MGTQELWKSKNETFRKVLGKIKQILNPEEIFVNTKTITIKTASL